MFQKLCFIILFVFYASFEFTAFGSVFNLRLIKVNVLNTLVLSEDTNGDLINANYTSIPMYVDKEAEASLMIKGKKEKGQYSIEGTIGDNFMINPIQKDTENKHIVTKRKTKDLANDYMIPEIVKTENDENQRQRRSAPSVVRPEVLVVVDSTLYAKLGKDTSATNQYIRNFWSAVNLRFRTISNPKVELNIAGIVISKTPASTPFLKNSKVSSNTFNAATIGEQDWFYPIVEIWDL